MHGVVLLVILHKLIFARITRRIDVELSTGNLPAPKVLTDQENGPVTHDEDDVDGEALCPLRGLENRKYGNWVEAEERPADCHHGLWCVSGCINAGAVQNLRLW